jgi:hypothetical protein
MRWLPPAVALAITIPAPPPHLHQALSPRHHQSHLDGCPVCPVRLSSVPPRNTTITPLHNKAEKDAIAKLGHLRAATSQLQRKMSIAPMGNLNYSEAEIDARVARAVEDAVAVEQKKLAALEEELQAARKSQIQSAQQVGGWVVGLKMGSWVLVRVGFRRVQGGVG